MPLTLVLGHHTEVLSPPVEPPAQEPRLEAHASGPRDQCLLIPLLLPIVAASSQQLVEALASQSAICQVALTRAKEPLVDALPSGHSVYGRSAATTFRNRESTRGSSAYSNHDQWQSSADVGQSAGAPQSLAPIVPGGR
jgi:hypothetical protein